MIYFGKTFSGINSGKLKTSCLTTRCYQYFRQHLLRDKVLVITTTVNIYVRKWRTSIWAFCGLKSIDLIGTETF
jgi:hypothetical protein